MSDKHIRFSEEMVRALLDGRKTQTRRGLSIRGHRAFSEFGPSDTRGYDWHFRDSQKRWHDLRDSQLRERLPYAPGDRLWVREAWHAARSHDRTPPRDIPRDADIEHAATARCYAEIGLKGRLRPSIFMPCWASRLTLVVTDVRVERLQEISEADAWAEGCLEGEPWDSGQRFSPAEEPAPDGKGWVGWDCARDWFADLWDSLNAKHPGSAWADNPWVAAITFTVHRCNIDGLEARHD